MILHEKKLLPVKKDCFAILSTERDGVATKRAEKLGIDVYQGLGNRRKTQFRLYHEKHINIDNVVFIGNDINDL